MGKTTSLLPGLSQDWDEWFAHLYAVRLRPELPMADFEDEHGRLDTDHPKED